jgi:hypothetical protein
MFPDTQDSPTEPTKAGEIAGISASCRVDFRPPRGSEFVPPKREPESVPKVTIDENCHLKGTKNEIGTARQVFGVSFERHVFTG